MTDPLRELVLPKLDGVRPSGSGYTARCPAHEDHRASLMIARGDKHPVVLTCHAGCHRDDIVAALGLAWEDLTAPRDEQPSTQEWTPAGPAVAVYDYRDEAGELLFQVLRTAGKDFRQRRPDPTAGSGWAWNLRDVRRVPYRLPKIVEAVAEGREVWIVEGEKDVHTLERVDVDATCNPGGAGKWRPEFADVFRDAIVTVVADRDNTGQAHARAVRDSLVGVAAFVRIVEAAEGKDITDHLAAGKTLDEVTVTFESEPRSTGPDLAPDLHQFLAATDDEEDWVVPGFFERGDRLIVTGFEGNGKTTLLRQFAVAAAAGLDPFQPLSHPAYQPCRVLFIDCENNERQSRRRFRPLARASVDYDHRVPDGGLRLIHRPEGVDLTRDDYAEWLWERVMAHAPDVIVIGSLYKLHTADINAEPPARRVVSVLDEARSRSGCVLITEAHPGHAHTSEGQRSLRPAGSSVFLRWPEFGFGLRGVGQADTWGRFHDVEIAHWRGGRVDRRWPHALAWTERGWPWQPPLGAALHLVGA